MSQTYLNAHKDKGKIEMILPSWNGAESVYTRLLKIAQTIQKHEYETQRLADKRKSFRFSPHPDGLEISAALNEGDEETCKALLARHFYVRGIWINA